ncbi:MAG: hypothetical protein AAF478_10800 [Pseudomonadota bacterium]
MAAQRMDELLDGVPSILRDAAGFKSVFSKDELNIIRTDQEFTIEMFQKFVVVADDIYYQLRDYRDLGVKQPKLEEIPNVFLYRISFALMLNYLRWEEVGGVNPATDPKKVRNDFVDMHIATYASYFDGLLSKDKRLCGLHVMLSFMINVLIHNVKFEQARKMSFRIKQASWIGCCKA